MTPTTPAEGYTTEDALREAAKQSLIVAVQSYSSLERMLLDDELDEQAGAAHSRAFLSAIDSTEATISALDAKAQSLRERVETADRERDMVAEIAADYSDETGYPCPPDEWIGEARRRLATLKATQTEEG